MSLSLYEQETIINFNEKEKTASVYTHNRALCRKLERLAEERPNECRLTKTSHDGKAVDYSIPKAWVKIKPPRVASEAQKEAAREAARKSLLSRTANPHGEN